MPGTSSWRTDTPWAITSGVARHLGPVRQTHHAVRVFAAEGHRLLRAEQLGPEPLRLGGGAPSKVGAGHSGGKAEVVLDP